MSIQENNIRLENNNTNLNEIYNAINNLPTLKLQDKSVTPTMEQQTITADESYTGLNSVSVEAIQDENLVPENIKNDVEILGIKGSFVGSKYAPRHIYFRNYTGTELDYEVANLDTSNITNMSYMFYNCSKLTNLDLSNWNTSNVTNMNSMFEQCRELTSINMSNFDTSKVTQLTYAFFLCTELKYLDIRSFTFDNVAPSSTVFNGIPAKCQIIVKGDTEKEWVLTARSDLTNVKTVAEYEAS